MTGGCYSRGTPSECLMMCCHISTWSVTHSTFPAHKRNITNWHNRDTSKWPQGKQTVSALACRIFGEVCIFPRRVWFPWVPKFNACIKSPIIEHQTGNARILASCLLKDRKREVKFRGPLLPRSTGSMCKRVKQVAWSGSSHVKPLSQGRRLCNARFVPLKQCS